MKSYIQGWYKYIHRDIPWTTNTSEHAHCEIIDYFIYRDENHGKNEGKKIYILTRTFYGIIIEARDKFLIATEAHLMP